MIIDTLKNAGLYRGLGERVAAGLDFLVSQDLASLPPGKIELRGNDLYALVQTYDSRPIELAKWEAHRKYIDIQLIVSGVERLGYASVDTLTVTEPYDEEKDYMLLDGPGQYARAEPGTFLIFYPHDAHSPGVAIDSPSKVKKVVVKVRV